MSHFEYTFIGDLSPEYEEKTKQIIGIVNGNNSPFKINKYYDEEIDGKQTRTLILTSFFNMVPHILNMFSGCPNIKMQAFHKICLI